MLKILKHKYLKIFFIILIILYFYNTLDIKKIYDEFNSVNTNFLFISIIILLPNTLLLVYKWYLISKKKSKLKFLILYKKLTHAIFLSDLLHNPTPIELTKFFNLKTNNYEKAALIFNDKLITLLTKVTYSFFFLIIIYQTEFINYIIFFFHDKIHLKFIIFFYLFILLIFFLRKIIFRYYSKYLSSFIIERKKILVIEILRNILMSIVYFLSFFQFTTFENALLFTAISPLIEISLRLQIITSFGFREIIILSIGSFLNLDQKIIISSLFITFVTITSSFINFLIISILDQKSKKIIKNNNVNNVGIYFHQKKLRGYGDFYDLLRIIAKKEPRLKICNSLDFNYKIIIIQENFLNPLFFFKLLFFFKFYSGKTFILLTEFFTQDKFGNVTYNSFDKSQIIKHNFIILILILLLCKIIKLLNLNYNKFEDLHYKAHHKLRYLTTKFFTKYTYGFILAHPQIKPKQTEFKNKKTINFPYLFPFYKINKNLNKKKFFLEFSGQLTKYRLKILNKINKKYQLVNLDQIQYLLKKDSFKFISNKKNYNFKKTVFSLHIKKDNNWKYSSPTRYFNSLKNNKIPVVFKKNNDLFCRICLRINYLSKSRKKILDEFKRLNNSIEKVNDLSKKNIDYLVNL